MQTSHPLKSPTVPRTIPRFRLRERIRRIANAGL